jgi:uncharacterized membrane protein
MNATMHTPPSLRELRKLRRPLRNVNVVHRERFTRLERLAIWVANHVGSPGFFIIIFGWTILWLGWNTVGPLETRFDPFPAFVLWLFISNMVQIFLMPLIMIGQNLQGRYAETRAEQDFEVNLKAEREVEAVLMHLENQNELILKILGHLERGKSGKRASPRG